jgi:hypothetical protein
VPLDTIHIKETMTHIRGALTTLPFIVLSAVSLAAAAQALFLGLPETLASNVTVLISALATEDVSVEPRPAKLKLGQRVNRELYEDVDWQAELAALTDGQRQRLVENVAELAKESFDVNVEEYFKVPERARKRVLDRQIDQLTHWAVIVDRVSRPDGQPLVRPDALISLFARAAQWYRDATPEHLKKMQEYQRALRDQMTKRMMRRMNPTGP